MSICPVCLAKIHNNLEIETTLDNHLNEFLKQSHLSFTSKESRTKCLESYKKYLDQFQSTLVQSLMQIGGKIITFQEATKIVENWKHDCDLDMRTEKLTCGHQFHQKCIQQLFQKTHFVEESDAIKNSTMFFVSLPKLPRVSPGNSI